MGRTARPVRDDAASTGICPHARRSPNRSSNPCREAPGRRAVRVLAGFWDSSRRHEYYSLPDLETFEATARQRNLDKQAGFYVDRSGASVTSPLHVPDGEVEADIQRGAQVIQVHLIEDHTRQQDAPDLSLIDSAEGLHWAVMPYAQPEEFAAFVERVSDNTVT